MVGRKDLLTKCERLRVILTQYSTGGRADDAEYKQLREELIKDPLTRAELPHFVRSCRNLADFWAFIKSKFDHYAERRAYLKVEFDPLLSALEEEGAPADDSVSGILSHMDSEHVALAWQKALARRSTDPEGAITAARTLLETAYKYILDESAAAYNRDVDLPKLYSMVALSLNLSPSKQVDRVLRQITGGCEAAVEGLGALRNRLGDAHGIGKGETGPTPLEAELAVNLAGSIAVFFVETWQARIPHGP